MRDWAIAVLAVLFAVPCWSEDLAATAPGESAPVVEAETVSAAEPVPVEVLEPVETPPPMQVESAPATIEILPGPPAESVMPTDSVLVETPVEVQPEDELPPPPVSVAVSEPSPPPLDPAPMPELEAAPPPEPERIPPAEMAAHESTPVAVEPEPAPVEAALNETMGQVLAEVAELREQVDLMQKALDTYLGSIVTDLQAENDRLREEVRQLYQVNARAPLKLEPLPAETFDELNLPALEPGPDLDAILEQDEAVLLDSFNTAPAAAPEYKVLAEWGRSANDAARLGQDTPSLKGMVAVVQPGASEAALTALGRELREKFAEFDNINIDVFDDPVSAQVYIEQNVDPEGRCVMTVSKHARSNRDVVILHEGQDMKEVPAVEE